MKIPSISVALSRLFISKGAYVYNDPDVCEELGSAVSTSGGFNQHYNTSKNSKISEVLSNNLKYNELTKKTLTLVLIEGNNDTLKGKLEDYNYHLTAWSKGLILALNDTLLIYHISKLGNESNYEITKTNIVKLSSNNIVANEITHMIVIRNCLYTLQKDNSISAISLQTTEIISQVQLSTPITSFTVVQLQDANLVLGMGPTSLLVVVTHEYATSWGKLYVGKESNTLLNFWPVGVIHMSRHYLYIIGPKGNFQIYRYSSNSKSLVETDSKALISIFRNQVGDNSFGRIRDVIQVGNHNSLKWVILQEYGWVIYELNGGTLIDLISSPSNSQFEKAIVMAEEDSSGNSEDGYQFAVLLVNQDIMYIKNGNVQLIYKSGSNLLDFVFFDNDNLIGLFRSEDNHFILKSATTNDLSWVPLIAEAPTFLKFTASDEKFRSEFRKTFDDFTVFWSNSEGNLTVVDKYDETTVLSRFSSIGYEIHEIIEISDLVPPLTSPDGLLKHRRRYLIIIDKHSGIHVLILNWKLTRLINSCSIEANNFKSMNYWENLNYLELTNPQDINHKRILLSLDTLLHADGYQLNDSKIEIFKNDTLFSIGDLPIVLNDYSLGNNVKFVPFDHLLQDEKLTGSVLNTLIHDSSEIRWISIGDEGPKNLTFYNSTVGINQHSVKFLLLLGILSSESCLTIPTNVNELFLAYALDNFDSYHLLLKELCSFCLSSDERISDQALEFLNDMLAGIGWVNDSIIKVWLPYLKLNCYWDSNEDELDMVYSVLIFGLLLSHDSNDAYLRDDDIPFFFMDKLLLLLRNQKTGLIVKVMFKLISQLGVDIFNKKLIHPNVFFTVILQIRFDSAKSANMIVFDACNKYLSSILKDDQSMSIILVSNLLNLHHSCIEIQLSILDYINFILIETANEIDSNNLFILINALILYFIELQDHTKLHHENKQLWDTLDLTTNILTTKFHKSIGSHFQQTGVQERHSDLLHLSKHKAKICLMLDDVTLNIGYKGVILANSASHLKHHEKNWQLFSLKTGFTKLLNQKEDEDSFFQNLRFLKKNMGFTESLINPKFSLDGSKLSCFDFGDYSIKIWDLHEGKCQDQFDINIVNNVNIPLKVQNFYLLFLQSYWNTNRQLSKINTDTQLLPVLKEFQESIGKVGGMSGEVQTSGNHDGSEALVIESVGKISMVDLMFKYYNVFDDIKYDDLDMEWIAGDKIILKLKNKIVFVYSTV